MDGPHRAPFGTGSYASCMYYTCLMLYYFCTLLVPKPLSTSVAVQELQLHLEFILCDGTGTQWNWYYSGSGTHTDRS